MGNIQTQKSFELRSKLLSTSILKTLTFSSRQSLNLYIHQLRSRMTLRTYSIPKIVYFNQILPPKHLSCQSTSTFKLEIYFQDYGQAYSEQSVKVDQCKCMELLDAIEELKDRYGCFMISLSSIFVKREGNYRKVVVWINNQVQQCKPSNKCDENSMCQSIVDALEILMKGKCCQCYESLLNKKHKFNLFSKLKQEIKKSHIIPVNSISRNRKQTQKIFTFKQIINQTNEHKTSLPITSQLTPLPLQYLQQTQQNLQQNPNPQQHTQTIKQNQANIQSQQRQKIPPLNMKSLSQYKNDQNSQSQRIILSRHQSIHQIKQLYNQQKQCQDIITTGRSPERNYIMRKSDQLTIFPNQYLIKFQNKHKINCEAQIKQSYLAFRKAMNTLKAKENHAKEPHAPKQNPILSYRL